MSSFELSRAQYCSCETIQLSETNINCSSMPLHNLFNQETTEKAHEPCLLCINNIQIDPNFLHFINDNRSSILYEDLLDESISFSMEDPFEKQKKTVVKQYKKVTKKGRYPVKIKETIITLLRACLKTIR